MTGLELLALGGKAAGKAAFSKVLSETLGRLKNATQTVLSSRKIERTVSKLYTHLGKVRLVKTLWQIDKAVDIGTFYCESHVYVARARKKIASMADFKGLGNLLVEGIAGQGKSIFLRYLCGVEMVRGEYIPVFVELRRVFPGTKLQDHILTSLSEFGYSGNLVGRSRLQRGKEG